MRRRYFMPYVEKTHEIPDDLIWLQDPRSILLLEDDNMLSEVLCNALSHRSFVVTHARGGAEGVQRVLRSDFDVILCDMIMPGFPGDMFYQAVQRIRPHLASRFLFMTGHTGDRRIDEFVRSVRGLMIFKPFQLHELLDAIKVVLKRAKSTPCTVPVPATEINA
jgi:DNA-binding response OmpR family regulator